VALGSFLGAGTPLRPRGAWAVPQCWAHVALGLQPLGGHSSAHTWSLGCLPGSWPHPQRACGA